MVDSKDSKRHAKSTPFLCVCIVYMIISCQHATAYRQTPGMMTADLTDRKAARLEQGYSSPLPSARNDKEARFCKGDVVEVSIQAGQEKYAAEAQIAPDGRLYCLFTDAIRAEGRTGSEVAADYTQSLSHLFLAPTVRISLKKKQGHSYMILGGVEKQGVYRFRDPITLSQAIQTAGGVISSNREVLLRNSFLLRDGRKVKIDGVLLAEKGSLDKDISIRPGDYIYIASAVLPPVFLIGAFPVKEIPYQEGMLLARDVFQKPIWKMTLPSQAVLIRGAIEERQVIVVHPTRIRDGKEQDIVLLPGDSMYVSATENMEDAVLIHTAIETLKTHIANREIN